MKKNHELSFKELKDICNPNIFQFDTTAELDDTNLIYGQDRGIKALEFGLNVDVKGYNLYIEGPTGVGKTMYTKHYLYELAKNKKSPNDWCYIYNFEEPNEPIAVALPAGAGKIIEETMSSFIKDIRVDLKRTFSNQDFEKEKALIKQEFEEKRNILLEKLNKKSMQHGFQVKTAQKSCTNYFFVFVFAKSEPMQHKMPATTSIQKPMAGKVNFTAETASGTLRRLQLSNPLQIVPAMSKKVVTPAIWFVLPKSFLQHKVKTDKDTHPAHDIAVSMQKTREHQTVKGNFDE